MSLCNQRRDMLLLGCLTILILLEDWLSDAGCLTLGLPPSCIFGLDGKHAFWDVWSTYVSPQTETADLNNLERCFFFWAICDRLREHCT